MPTLRGTGTHNAHVQNSNLLSAGSLTSYHQKISAWGIFYRVRALQDFFQGLRREPHSPYKSVKLHPFPQTNWHEGKIHHLGTHSSCSKSQVKQEQGQRGDGAASNCKEEEIGNTDENTATSSTSTQRTAPNPRELSTMSP